MIAGLAKETVLVLHVVQTTLPFTESRSEPILTVYNLGESLQYTCILSNYM